MQLPRAPLLTWRHDWVRADMRGHQGAPAHLAAWFPLTGPDTVLPLVPRAPGALSALCVGATRAERSAAGPDEP